MGMGMGMQWQCADGDSIFLQEHIHTHVHKATSTFILSDIHIHEFMVLFIYKKDINLLYICIFNR